MGELRAVIPGTQQMGTTLILQQTNEKISTDFRSSKVVYPSVNHDIKTKRGATCMYFKEDR